MGKPFTQTVKNPSIPVRPKVLESLDNLDAHVTSLDEAVNMLLKRIEFISRKTEETANNPVPMNHGAVEFCNLLESIRYRINFIEQKVTEATSKLEI